MPVNPLHIGRPAVDPVRDALRHLLGAERRLRRRTQGGPGDWTYPQILTLAALTRHPTGTSSEIARQAGMDPGTMTGVLDQLQAVGAIERTRNPVNRRAYVVELTERGRQLAAPSLTNWARRWDRQLLEFSDVELETTGRILTAIAEIFDGAASADGEVDAEPDGRRAA